VIGLTRVWFFQLKRLCRVATVDHTGCEVIVAAARVRLDF